jgi:signal transduction histidine kinase
VIGVLVVESRQPNAFGQDDLDVITAAANQAGVALGRARLLQETRKAREAAEAATHELSQALENLKATQRQLVEAEKMAALGGLVAGVAHEINTPVGIGVTAASLLEDKTTAFREIYQNGQMKRSDLEKYLDTASQSSTMILNNLYRAAELIQSFKQVAVDQSSEERRSFKVRQYLEEILLSLRPKLKRTQHRINIEGTDDLVLDSYPGAFSQIVTNLVMNSLIHAYGPDEAGQLTFDLKQKNKRLVFEYGDDGRGIPKEHLKKIFDPFFTTKRGHGGSGLGLHIIYNLVTQKLEGTIRCESEVGSGTRFVIDLPLERSTSNGN